MPVLATDTKAIVLLHTLDRKEIGRFRKFLSANYFNNNEVLLETFECLHKKKKQIEAGRFTREQLHHYLSTKCPTASINVTDLLSKLREQLEDFLVQTELDADPFLKKKLLSRSLAKRDVSQQFEKQQELAQAILEKKNDRTGHYFWSYFELQHEQFNHPDFTGNGTQGATIIDQTIHHLDNAYLFFRLKMECERLSRSRIYHTTSLPEMSNALLDYLQRADIVINPTVQIYQLILDLFTQPLDWDKFKRVVQTFRTNIALYEPIEAISVLQFLVNYSYWQYGRKEIRFRPILFDLYKLGIDHNIWMNYGRISDTSFTNIVTVAIGNEHYDWAIQFIEAYQKLLAVRHRMDATRFALANVYQRQGDFVKALEYLDKVDFRNFSYQIRARATAIRWRYEDLYSVAPQLDVDTLDDNLESFRRWLHHQKIGNLPPDKKVLYTNFVYAVRQLRNHALIAGRDEAVYKKLKTKIDGYDALLVPEWFSVQLQRIRK